MSELSFIIFFLKLAITPNEIITSKDSIENDELIIFYKWWNSNSDNKIYYSPYNKMNIKNQLTKYHITNKQTDKPNDINIYYHDIYKAIDIYNKLKEYNLLSIKDDKVYLLNSKTFTWNNIKSLKNDLNDNHLLDIIKNEIESYTKSKISTVTIYKLLLWYFRKIFVIYIINDILLYYKNKYKSEKCELIYNSVGSINITSDFDINITSNSLEITKTCKKIISLIIFKFNKSIENIFHNSAAIVFDTNLYGSSFFKNKYDQYYSICKDNTHNFCITDVQNNQCNLKSCNSIFTYQIKNTKIKSIDNLINTSVEDLNENENINDIYDQHTWAIIKTLLNLKKLSSQQNIKISCYPYDFYKWIYDSILTKYKDNIQLSTMIKIADNFIKSHENHGKEYISSIYTSDILIKKFGINNSLSFTNYFGNETYFTRGAFVDVVVNQQMLKNNEIIHLDSFAYLDSFIENLSDYVLHDFNDKYLKRAESALQNIIKIEQKNNKIPSSLPNTIKNDEHHCNKIKEIIMFIFVVLNIMI
jgi:hypothetical protein